jgi:hypothetical protein
MKFRCKLCQAILSVDTATEADKARVAELAEVYEYLNAPVPDDLLILIVIKNRVLSHAKEIPGVWL